MCEQKKTDKICLVLFRRSVQHNASSCQSIQISLLVCRLANLRKVCLFNTFVSLGMFCLLLTSFFSESTIFIWIRFHFWLQNCRSILQDTRNKLISMAIPEWKILLLVICSVLLVLVSETSYLLRLRYSSSESKLVQMSSNRKRSNNFPFHIGSCTMTTERNFKYCGKTDKGNTGLEGEDGILRICALNQETILSQNDASVISLSY